MRDRTTSRSRCHATTHASELRTALTHTHAARRHATKHSAHLPTHAAQLMAIGDTMVGKTSLVMRYADDDFNENVLATIGIDFKIKVRRRPRIRSWWRPRQPPPARR